MTKLRERNKQENGISVIYAKQGKKNIVRAYNFVTDTLLYKRLFDDANSANNMYENIIFDKDEPSGLRGRYDYLTYSLNEGFTK